MAQIDWNGLMNGSAERKKRYHGANVKFFNAYQENRDKSLAAGRAVYDELPSISIQYPGGDETVRRIEPHDIQEYGELYAAFQAGNAPIENGTPLQEWAPLGGSALRELRHLGFTTVEQLAETNDEVKRRLGTLSKFVKMAKDWLGAANSTQFQVTALTQQLDAAQKRTLKLEEQVELLMQRIEANEGTDLRPRRREVIRSIEEIGDSTTEDGDDWDAEEGEPEAAAPRKRGRPRKV
ncbi:MAG: hypothetical protein ACRC9R_07955 [Enterovibrio sp.]